MRARGDAIFLGAWAVLVLLGLLQLWWLRAQTDVVGKRERRTVIGILLALSLVPVDVLLRQSLSDVWLVLIVVLILAGSFWLLGKRVE